MEVVDQFSFRLETDQSLVKRVVNVPRRMGSEVISDHLVLRRRKTIRLLLSVQDFHGS
jgi:hypothetical protein